MEIETFDIEGLILIKPKAFEDERGFFMESYNKKKFEEIGIDVEFVQDNHSKSSKGVLRGLHFQTPPFAQDKLVRVTRGEVLDIAVDIRKGSATYGMWQGVILNEENRHMFFVPKGFAHGFAVLSEVCDFQYKVSNYYSAENDGGIIWNDPEIGIDWQIEDPLISEKDSKHPLLKDFTTPFNVR